MSTRWRSAIVIIAGLALAAGCSADAASEAPTNGGGVPVMDGAPAPVAGPEMDEGSRAGDDAKYDPQAPTSVDERALIYTGSITLKVDDVVVSANRAADIATGLGGVVGGDQRSLNDDYSTATLTLRVPEAQFSRALDELARIGEEEERRVDTTDVTDQMIDLDVRIATQEASVERVRALLAQATTIGEVVSIESELTRRQADLDSFKQRREKLAGLVALSTITVYLHGPAVAVIDEEPETGFIAGIKAGWHGFLISVKVLLTVIGWLLPWAIVIGVPLWLLVWLVTRRRRPTTTP